ncbi:MAG: hypothetical protein WDZ49_14545 [Litorilinea sp.]
MKTKQSVQRFLIALFVIVGLALSAGNLSPAPANSYAQSTGRFLSGRDLTSEQHHGHKPDAKLQAYKVQAQTVSATTKPEYKYVPVRRY